MFENQNRLSELLFHTTPIDWEKETYADDETGAELSYRFHADGKQILYLYGKDLQQAEITVNGAAYSAATDKNLSVGTVQ